MIEMNNDKFSTYAVSWQVSVRLPASMEVKAPADLDEGKLIQYIRENCSADFKIDTDELDYDSGFDELEYYFDSELVLSEQD
jgi:hypothetical protein